MGDRYGRQLVEDIDYRQDQIKKVGLGFASRIAIWATWATNFGRYGSSVMSNPMKTREKMVGAKGFEPSTSWSRNRVAKILKALSGVAYETERADFSLSVVSHEWIRKLAALPCCQR
jgi:hypothetical protein